MNINKNYENLKGNYLFATVASKIEQFKKQHPQSNIINMGIGDVTLPLCEAVINSLSEAVSKMGKKQTFKGYGPYRGYDFLIDAIIKEYESQNIYLNDCEIFINDGAKSDCANILDILAPNQKVLIPDPVYPAYVDTNIMYGNEIIFSDGTMQNNFLPTPQKDLDVDIIYICSPNNPTGATYDKEKLKQWVDFANNKDALIIFDAAYKDFITDKKLPKSIFEIEDANRCAIQVCSFSKNAGFTGTRCGYTIIPKELKRDGTYIKDIWLRHQTSHYNGTSYIIQCAAKATFSEQGKNQIEQNLNYYKQNAKIICDALDKLNVFYTGGINSPYIWFKCVNNMTSWKFFDVLLNELQIVGTPGEGFGRNGANFFRLTAFSTKENTVKAMQLITDHFLSKN